MEKILGVIDRVSEYQGKLFSFLLVVATLQISYELTLRYVFNAPTDWGLELTEFFCAATYVMGGAFAYLSDDHIKVDLFYLNWSRRTKAVMDVCVSHLVFFFFMGILVWQSGIWLVEAIGRGETTGSVWDPPVWPMRLVLFLGSLTLLLQGIAKFIRDFLVAFGKGRS